MNAFRLDVIIPLLSVFLSGLLCLVFGAIYLTRLSRRSEYLAFSIFSLFLTMMMFATFCYQEAQGFAPAIRGHYAPIALIALRMQFVAAAGTAGSLWHFVIYLLRQEATRRRTLRCVDLLTAGFMAAPFSNAVLHPPIAPGPILEMDNALMGPSFPCYLVALVAFVPTALLTLQWGLRSVRRHGSGELAISPEDSDRFDVLARYGRRIFAGTIVLFCTGAIDAIDVLDLPPLRHVEIPFAMRFVGLTFFCIQVAGVLGIEIKRSELRKATLLEENLFLSVLTVQRAEDMQHIHHDVGNKVISVQAMIEAVIDASRDSAAYRELACGLSAALEESRSASRLIEEILYRAQAESGDQPAYTRREAIDLPAWIHRLVDNRRQVTEAAKRGADLRSEELPPNFEFRVESHLSRTMRLVNTISLEQILTNLLDNAVKYSPDGGTITVTLSEQPGALRICVRDRGDGIAKEDQQLIFALRRRGNRPFGKITGKGIGLHHVRRLLEEQGGAITVKSDGISGMGAAFTVVLPELRSAEEPGASMTPHNFPEG